ncbi:hypothetical protein PbJCM17693_43530 [Paenibacillus macerans]|nr:hypothetical protein PbJCM17693_43530 [Paenibacillus macerans]
MCGGNAGQLGRERLGKLRTSENRTGGGKQEEPMMDGPEIMRVWRWRLFCEAKA